MRQLLIWMLLGALINIVCVTSAPAQVDKDARRVAKVRRNVNKVGVDENVKVKFLDGTHLKGRINAIGDDYFVLIEKKTADTRRVTFAEVKQVGRVADNPFGNPLTWVGIALIPTIIGLSIWAKGVD